MYLQYQYNNLVIEYGKCLAILGSYSRLFSDSTSPYLSSRTVERLFCHIFGARDVSRDDSSFDAILKNEGIGIKTFLESGQSKFEKIAEFNKDIHELNSLHGINKARKIGFLRNKRLELSSKLYSVNKSIYHCVTRKNSEISIIECPMVPIDIKKITVRSDTNSTLSFSDNLNDYSYSKSKNTLYMKFKLTKPIFSVKVDLIPDFTSVMLMLSEIKGSTNLKIRVNKVIDKSTESDLPFVILPLYSVSGQKKIVHEKSGLNQWNASGRSRHFDEVYIPISKTIHDLLPGFFPPRNKEFTLVLPNGNIMFAKVCQQGSKALMTNPNRDLGKWILRDILEVPKGKLVDYNLLETYGIDSVKISKRDDSTFLLDFSSIGSYEDFINRKYLESI